MPQQGRQLGSANHYVSPGYQRIERPGIQFRGNGLKCFHREYRHSGVHVGRLAEEPVPDDALAGHKLGLLSVRRRNIRSTFAGTAEIGVRRRHQKMQNLDVVPVLSGHLSTLTPRRFERGFPAKVPDQSVHNRQLPFDELGPGRGFPKPAGVVYLRKFLDGAGPLGPFHGKGIADDFIGLEGVCLCCESRDEFA
jgi:hypothetical protein